MEKREKIKKSSISKSEYELIEKVKNSNLTLFSASHITKLLGWEKKKAYLTLYNLKNKNIISSLTGGKYILSSMFKVYDPLGVASGILWPSYVSFWTALNFYKFTEQLPGTIFVATTKAKKEIKFENAKIRFVSISEKRFFGYRKVDNIVIAEKEKALVDSLLLPRYSGGIREISKCLENAWSELDKKILIEYALRMKNRSLLKRLGYIIEKENLKIDKGLIEKLQGNIGGKGYSKLEPQLPRKGGYDKKWGLVVNL